MKSKNYYRVRSLIRILFWSAIFSGVVFLSGHINWVGDHYCFKSINECYLGGK